LSPHNRSGMPPHIVSSKWSVPNNMENALSAWPKVAVSIKEISSITTPPNSSIGAPHSFSNLRHILSRIVASPTSTVSALLFLIFKLRSLRSVGPPNGAAATPVYAVTSRRPRPRRLNSRRRACTTADLPVPPAPAND
jgi:hypothetical protein